MTTANFELPPIKRHRIDHDKALNRVNENVTHHKESGEKSRVFQIVNPNEV